MNRSAVYSSASQLLIPIESLDLRARVPFISLKDGHRRYRDSHAHRESPYTPLGWRLLGSSPGFRCEFGIGDVGRFVVDTPRLTGGSAVVADEEDTAWHIVACDICLGWVVEKELAGAVCCVGFQRKWEGEVGRVEGGGQI